MTLHIFKQATIKTAVIYTVRREIISFPVIRENVEHIIAVKEPKENCCDVKLNATFNASKGLHRSFSGEKPAISNVKKKQTSHLFTLFL